MVQNNLNFPKSAVSIPSPMPNQSIKTYILGVFLRMGRNRRISKEVPNRPATRKVITSDYLPLLGLSSHVVAKRGAVKTCIECL